ncbi:MAG TPA: hypothetical protein VN364_05415, partial [Bellilinea sp.]|nr:hypothetical protein [Bellilinea sp.]
SQPATVAILLFVQILPLMIFPLEIFNSSSQQWWLPLLLTILALFAVVKIVFQRTTELWPWYLVSFSQGFNIISRLMMLMPHATKNAGGVQVADFAYLITNIVAIIISFGYIIFSELPEVRLSLLNRKEETA